MKKHALLVILALLMLFQSGCLTITEKYKVNRDGSGSMEYTIDMSGMQSFMQAFSDSTMQGSHMMEIDQSFRQILPYLAATQGISNAMLTGDPGNFVYGIKYDFDDQQALNIAMAVILNEEDEHRSQFVELGKKRFIRYPLTTKEITDGKLFGGKDSSENSLALQIMDEMNYKISVMLPKRVKKVSSGAGITQENDRKVIINATFSQIVNNNEILRTEIKTR